MKHFLLPLLLVTSTHIHFLQSLPFPQTILYLAPALSRTASRGTMVRINPGGRRGSGLLTSVTWGKGAQETALMAAWELNLTWRQWENDCKSRTEGEK
jgi:hypothetical protein